VAAGSQVENEFFALQLLQQRFRNPLDLCGLLLRQLDFGLSQQVEDHEFFFAQLFCDSTLLARHVTGDVHSGLVARAALGEFRQRFCRI
jgi:hypothetical protein